MRRADCGDVAAFLAEVLAERPDALAVGEYAQALRERGFTAAALRGLRPAEMEGALDGVPTLRAGHRALLMRRAEANVSWLELHGDRTLRRLVAALEACAGALDAARRRARRPRRSLARRPNGRAAICPAPPPRAPRLTAGRRHRTSPSKR